MYICKCGREFNNSHGFNGHQPHCKFFIKKGQKISIYKINDNLYKCECNKEFNNYQSLNAHFTHCLIHRNGKKPTNEGFGEIPWNKGLSIETDVRIKQSIELLKFRYKIGELTSPMRGKLHTNKSKEKMSLHANNKNNGYVKTKWYDIFCPYENKNIKVQGTWELKYAEYLNKNNIQWIRPKEPLHYKLFEEDYIHSYYPDFYLINTNEFVEIKGFWWKSKDGNVDDKRKMENVINQNKDKKILIIEDIRQYC